MLDRVMRAGERILEYIVIISLLFMFSLVFTNVVLRFGFSSGIAIGEELARYAFVWCTFIGAALVLKARAHIGIEGIRHYLPRRWMRLFDTLVVAIIFAMNGVVLVGSVFVLLSNVGVRSPVSGAPLTLAIASIVVGSFVMLIVLCTQAVSIWSRPQGE